MPKCPHCGKTIGEFKELNYTGIDPLDGGAGMYSCPSCDSILGVTAW